MELISTQSMDLLTQTPIQEILNHSPIPSRRRIMPKKDMVINYTNLDIIIATIIFINITQRISISTRTNTEPILQKICMDIKRFRLFNRKQNQELEMVSIPLLKIQMLNMNLKSKINSLGLSTAMNSLVYGAGQMEE